MVKCGAVFVIYLCCQPMFAREFDNSSELSFDDEDQDTSGSGDFGFDSNEESFNENIKIPRKHENVTFTISNNNEPDLQSLIESLAKRITLENQENHEKFEKLELEMKELNHICKLINETLLDLHVQIKTNTQLIKEINQTNQIQDDNISELEIRSKDIKNKILEVEEKNKSQDITIGELKNRTENLDEKIEQLKTNRTAKDEKLEVVNKMFEHEITIHNLINETYFGHNIMQLKKKIEFIDMKVNRNDQQLIRNVLVFTNVSEKSGERYLDLLRTVVITILNKHMELRIEPEEIADVHRVDTWNVRLNLVNGDNISDLLPHRYPGGKYPRPVVVRFVNHLTKWRVLQVKTNLINTTNMRVFDVYSGVQMMTVDEQKAVEEKKQQTEKSPRSTVDPKTQYEHVDIRKVANDAQRDCNDTDVIILPD